jgi:hypothetical protein
MGGGPMRAYGSPNIQATDLAGWAHPGDLRNIYAGYASVSNKSGYPNGTRHPVSWSMPPKAGGLSSYMRLNGVGSITLNLAGGLNGEATLTGSGSISDAELTGLGFVFATLAGVGSISDAELKATGALIATIPGVGSVSATLNALGELVASLAGSGAISSANLQSIVAAVATLSGSGSVSAADLTAVGVLAATVAGVGSISNADARAIVAAVAILTGSGSITATLQAIGHAIATLSGTGTVSPVINAIGHMEADIQPFTELSPQSLAAAVWSSLASAFNEPGTMGGIQNITQILLRNKVVTDPSTGKMTVYDTDGSTVLYEADLFEDVAGTIPYAGAGAERRDRFEP